MTDTQRCTCAGARERRFGHARWPFGNPHLHAASAALLGLGLVLLSASQAGAACQGTFPDFSEVVPTAHTVIIGTVTSVEPAPEDPPGYFRVFELHVDHVLRGQSDALLRIRDLKPQPCSDFLRVPEGAVIALAMGKAYQPAIDVTAPAYIHGVSYEATQAGAIGVPETFTLDEVFELVGVPMPSTATSIPAFPSVVGLVLVVLSAGLTIQGAARWRNSLSSR